jgi:hypothetical protein
LGGIEVKGLPPAVRGAFSVGAAGGGGGGAAGVVAVVVVVVVVVVVEVSGALLSFELHPTASHAIAERAIPPATSDRRLVGDLILFPICSSSRERSRFSRVATRS